MPNPCASTVVASPFSVGNPAQPLVNHLVFDHTSVLKLIEWRFGWSVSRSQVARVTQYIANQKKHHSKICSQEEFKILLKKHGFEYHGD
jgi:hypothetical protein